MLIAVGSLTAIGLGLGGLLGVAARLLAVDEDPLEVEIQAMLPGSQCGQCGYVGCAQAAAALARGEAPVTLCTPGGKAVAEQLAKRLGVRVDLSNHTQRAPVYAQIVEDLCIGCTRCIKECSVDAIVGASKLMHSVMTETCHGCSKCAAVCPTDAIRLIEVPVTLSSWHWPKPAATNRPAARHPRSESGEVALAWGPRAHSPWSPSPMKLFPIRGGIHPEYHKELTGEHAIEALPLPSRLYIPLQQHIGVPRGPGAEGDW